MLKSLGDQGIEMLTHIFFKLWETGKYRRIERIPIIPIFKKGDNNCCENYRGITPLSVVSKIYEDILKRWLKGSVDKRLSVQNVLKKAPKITFFKLNS